MGIVIDINLGQIFGNRSGIKPNKAAYRTSQETPFTGCTEKPVA
jgi:hypothetical protein